MTRLSPVVDPSRAEAAPRSSATCPESPLASYNGKDDGTFKTTESNTRQTYAIPTPLRPAFDFKAGGASRRVPLRSLSRHR